MSAVGMLSIISLGLFGCLCYLWWISRPHKGMADEYDGYYQCTRCGASEVEARANGCPRGPCPMELV